MKSKHCPNGCGDLESNKFEQRCEGKTDGMDVDVIVHFCVNCYYSEAETK